jgi:AhpD family alkylhydroperoxidase
MRLVANEVLVDRRRRSTARVPLDAHRGVVARLSTWYSRRTYGDVLDAGLAMMHNRRVLWTYAGFEMSVARWHGVDEELKMLAVLAAAGVIECSWCMDFGFYEARGKGVPTEKLTELSRWRESAVFTPVERRVIEYAEAMTRTPNEVTDELAAALRDDLGDAGLVELTMMVSVENLRSRFNSALGLRSQGFRERCELAR